MSRFFLALMLTLTASSVSAQSLDEKQAIRLGGTIIELEVARTSVEHRTGLMYRKFLPENHGMLFVFTTPRSIAIWMKNTFIDLDAAFIDACGQITQIVTMQKGTLDLHQSRLDTSRVIEMNAGWFEQHNIKVGTQIPSLTDARYCKRPSVQP